jgi:hypothetical protein
MRGCHIIVRTGSVTYPNQHLNAAPTNTSVKHRFILSWVVRPRASCVTLRKGYKLPSMTTNYTSTTIFSPNSLPVALSGVVRTVSSGSV